VIEPHKDWRILMLDDEGKPISERVVKNVTQSLANYIAREEADAVPCSWDVKEVEA
jgi:hypothetical protein